tara:strand:- start:5290 stop:5562 length:273 start_codon:yes stop_codon:yes gene_type:complete
MGFCSFCNEKPTPTYWEYYCEDCAMLRRMLKIHDSKKCCEILKRVLIRNPQQIGYKIDSEITEDNTHKMPVKTRSQSKRLSVIPEEKTKM